jgi:hypothetical protein
MFFVLNSIEFKLFLIQQKYNHMLPLLSDHFFVTDICFRIVDICCFLLDKGILFFWVLKIKTIDFFLEEFKSFCRCLTWPAESMSHLILESI